MTYLLDTHVLLWWLFNDRRLSDTARALIADPSATIIVSSASAWEISTKYRLGKLPSAAEFLRDMSLWIRRAGFRELPVTVAHVQRAGSWPQPHRDPFDRMLAAQSVIEQLPIVTHDPAFATFAIQIVW